MAVEDDVHAILRSWAAWARVGLDRIGYPPLSTYCRNYSSGYRAESYPTAAPDAVGLMVDALVRRLSEPRRRLVMVHYLRCVPLRERVKIARMPVWTYYRELDSARRALADMGILEVTQW